MTYSILYSLPGDQFICRQAKVLKTEQGARKFCGNLLNFPAEAIHVAITCDDGRVIYDTTVDGVAIFNDWRAPRKEAA